MVKTKHQKSNSKRHPNNKRSGKSADISQFSAQLDSLNLQIVQVTADGNCFFRALADQLDGEQEEHGKYRKMVVQYISKNREMFEPFIEDDVPFDEYCESMEKDGTWAGHLELQAASLVTHCNICIHKMSSPRWYIRNFEDREACMIHLSYHDEEHYNSVRLKEDTCAGPARPIIIKADADASANSFQAKVLANNAQKRGVAISPGFVKLVMAGSGCENAETVEKILAQVDGDVDAAIEFLVAEQGSKEHEEPIESPPCHKDSYLGVGEFKNCERSEEQAVENHDKVDSSSHSNKHTNSNGSQPDDKRIPRNKVCPCGSKKKYKACCGTVSGRSSTKYIVLKTVDSKKTRKERKMGKKSGPAKVELSSESDELPHDMGALCI